MKRNHVVGSQVSHYVDEFQTIMLMWEYYSEERKQENYVVAMTGLTYTFGRS